LHSLWTPEPSDKFFKVSILAGLEFQDELDKLVQARGEQRNTPHFVAIHP
jgi:hypothetical protein